MWLWRRGRPCPLAPRLPGSEAGSGFGAYSGRPGTFAPVKTISANAAVRPSAGLRSEPASPAPNLFVGMVTQRQHGKRTCPSVPKPLKQRHALAVGQHSQPHSDDHGCKRRQEQAHRGDERERGQKRLQVIHVETPLRVLDQPACRMNGGISPRLGRHASAIACGHCINSESRKTKSPLLAGPSCTWCR